MADLSEAEVGMCVSQRRRRLTRLMACTGKRSVANMKNKLLFDMPTYTADELRRAKNPLHQCMIWELEEAGYTNSSVFLEDLVTDNVALLAQDEIGIVVDLRKKAAYLERLQLGLRAAEGSKVRGESLGEALTFLELALYFSEEEKGIMWLAEKLFLIAVAVAGQHLTDGGRQAACCRYYYGKFLLDKFPNADTEEPYGILSAVRDACIGKSWRLGDGGGDQSTVFAAVAVQLHRVLLQSARAVRAADPHRADRLCRTAERRAKDAEDPQKLVEAITELGLSQLEANDLNNALRSFERAVLVAQSAGDVGSICEGHMHVASTLQRLGEYEGAVKSLSMMGTLSMKHGLQRHLGLALHLLGELYLRRANPDLATPHLREAFNCFLGDMSHIDRSCNNFINILATVSEEEEMTLQDGKPHLQIGDPDDINLLHETKKMPCYKAEAEQSRLMMAISSGQEKMASYFRLLLSAGVCNVARMQTLEWKLHGDGWWVVRRQHDLVPCLCDRHQRSPLDVLRIENERLTSLRQNSEILAGLRHLGGAKRINLRDAASVVAAGLDTADGEAKEK